MSTPRRNIELKARCADLQRVRNTILQMGARSAGHQHQIDTYFRVPHGRLKLREISNAQAELIWYQRPDQKQFRGSDYDLVPAPDPAALKTALTAACGLRGEVRKSREIYLYHNVRIHLDQVEGLGSFIEFEAVLEQGENEAASYQRLDELHRALQIDPADHCAQSYSDLLML